MKCPLLKYSVLHDGDGTSIRYRGKLIDLGGNKSTFIKIRSHLNGTNGIADIANAANTKISIVTTLIETLVSEEVAVYVSQDFNCLSGEKAFWLLEKDLCEYKFYGRKFYANSDIERQISSGSVSEDVAIGYLVELGYLLRNVPSELAYSINSSYDENVRSLFLHFFQEEYSHGEILYQELAKWLGSDLVLNLRPLPATFGLLNMYRWMASHPLLYATALMHDEGSPFDPIISEEEDVYYGLMNKYAIPKHVVEKFLWHANLDRCSDHGFFPLEVFKRFDVIDKETFKNMRWSLKGLFEMHGTYRKQILDFYSKHNYRERADFL